MVTLLHPDDLTSLVIRTEFGDDVAWEMLQAAIDSSHEQAYRFATYVSDPAFAGVTVQALVHTDSAASEDRKVAYLFVADETCLTDREHRLLAVDLHTEPGRTFRVPPRWFAEVSANLSITNMDFAEFADAADDSSTFRGFDGD
jgi:hypothetical protein